jgi:hypothetical protein
VTGFESTSRTAARPGAKGGGRRERRGKQHDLSDRKTTARHLVHGRKHQDDEHEVRNECQVREQHRRDEARRARGSRNEKRGRRRRRNQQEGDHASSLARSTDGRPAAAIAGSGRRQRQRRPRLFHAGIR